MHDDGVKGSWSFAANLGSLRSLLPERRTSMASGYSANRECQGSYRSLASAVRPFLVPSVLVFNHFLSSLSVRLERAPEKDGADTKAEPQTASCLPATPNPQNTPNPERLEKLGF